MSKKETGNTDTGNTGNTATGNKEISRDYLTVKEFSKFVDMPVDTILYYDRTGVFKPAKRGAPHANNYRLYSPTQITLFKMVHILKELEVPLKEIRELGVSRTPEKMIKLLRQKKYQIADTVRYFKELYSVVCTFHDLIVEGISVTETDIYVSLMPKKRIILGGVNDFGDNGGFFGEFCASATQTMCRSRTRPTL